MPFGSFVAVHKYCGPQVNHMSCARACVFCVTLKHPSESIKLNVSHSFSLSRVVCEYLFYSFIIFIYSLFITVFAASLFVRLSVYCRIFRFFSFCHTFVLEISLTALSQMHFKRINSSRITCRLHTFFAENR